MSAPIPSNRPLARLNEIEVLLKRHGYDKFINDHSTVLITIRGYYLNTMGEKGKNDLNQYDDFAAWLWPEGFSTFNFNTDPTRYGWNPNADKYMARLQPGCWDFVARHHKGQYPAFGQGDHKVTVDRVRQDGTVARTDTGLFGINVHRGGDNTTSSEGCLTVPVSQWSAFQVLGYKLLKQYNQGVFKHMLFDEAAERAAT